MLEFLFVCLFVCLFAVFLPLENFSLTWRRHHYRWRRANFDLRSAIKSIEKWGFFSVPPLQLLGASIYNGHLWGHMIPTPIVERWAVELSLPVLTTSVCCGWDSNTQLSACRRHRRGEFLFVCSSNYKRLSLRTHYFTYIWNANLILTCNYENFEN